MSGPAPREEQSHAPSTSSKFLVGKVISNLGNICR